MPLAPAHTANCNFQSVARRQHGAAGTELPSSDHAGLMSANLITLRHFSVSSARNLPKSADDPGSVVIPRSTMRAAMTELARPAFISLLRISIIWGDVPLGAPIPDHELAS